MKQIGLFSSKSVSALCAAIFSLAKNKFDSTWDTE